MLLIPLQHLYITSNYIRDTHVCCNSLLIRWMWHSAAWFILLIFSHDITIWKHSNHTIYLSVNTCFYLIVYKCLYFQSFQPDRWWLTGIKSGQFWGGGYTSQSWYSGLQFGVTGFIRMLVFIAGLACPLQEPGIGRNSCFFTCKSLRYSKRVGCHF